MLAVIVISSGRMSSVSTKMMFGLRTGAACADRRPPAASPDDTPPAVTSSSPARRAIRTFIPKTYLPDALGLHCDAAVRLRPRALAVCVVELARPFAHGLHSVGLNQLG